MFGINLHAYWFGYACNKRLDYGYYNTFNPFVTSDPIFNKRANLTKLKLASLAMPNPKTLLVIFKHCGSTLSPKHVFHYATQPWKWWFLPQNFSTDSSFPIKSLIKARQVH